MSICVGLCVFLCMYSYVYKHRAFCLLYKHSTTKLQKYKTILNMIEAFPGSIDVWEVIWHLPFIWLTANLPLHSHPLCILLISVYWVPSSFVLSLLPPKTVHYNSIIHHPMGLFFLFSRIVSLILYPLISSKWSSIWCTTEIRKRRF